MNMLTLNHAGYFLHCNYSASFSHLPLKHPFLCPHISRPETFGTVIQVTIQLLAIICHVCLILSWICSLFFQKGQDKVAPISLDFKVLDGAAAIVYILQTKRVTMVDDYLQVYIPDMISHM